MKKVLIIDDEPLARRIVKEYLGNFPEYEVVGECGDGFEGLKRIQEQAPDVVFLDIQMPKINGFELLELITEPPHIIFTTAFDEYALKAFESNAVDYLLKPFSKERFAAAVAKIPEGGAQRKQLEQLLESPDRLVPGTNRIVIKDGSEIRILPANEIIFLEAYDDYVKIHHQDKVHLKKQTMNHFENVLNSEQFVRIHRSFIINLNKLTRIESYEKNSYRAILVTGDRVPISRNYYQKLKNLLGV